MRKRLDCVIVGYNDDTEVQFRRLAACEKSTVERRVFLRNCISVEGRPMTYLDVVNYFAGKKAPWDAERQPYYHVGEVTNLAALYLASYLLKRGMTAKHISVFGAESKYLRSILVAERPRVVAITTTFYETVAPVAEIAAFVREYCRESLIVVGGPLITNLVSDLDTKSLQAAFLALQADVIVLESQGERTLDTLMHNVQNGLSLHNIANLFIRQGDQFQFTGADPETNDLDDCSINWNFFPEVVLGATVQTRTARSCAYQCAFCDYSARAGRLSVTSVQTVEAELESLRERGVRNVVFIDDTFNVPEDRFRALCEMLVRRRFGFRWFSYFRCGSVKHDDTFDLLAESGCAGVFLGIESGDPEVLRNMGKASTVEQYARGMEALRSRSIFMFASFICGFPGETDHSISNTIDFINSTKPTTYRMEPWWYNHRSPIHRRAKEFNLLGDGYAWEHSTMDAREACDGIDRTFQKVTAACWCPQQSFSFWALPYLLGKGMSEVQVIELHRRCHELLPATTDGPVAGMDLRPGSCHYDGLMKLVDSLELTNPRFSHSIHA